MHRSPIQQVACPAHEGLWRHVPTGAQVEVYKLVARANALCFWGPGIGGSSYTGVKDGRMTWKGHIPVAWWDNVGPWEFLDNL
jgi:hypothetical protein